MPRLSLAILLTTVLTAGPALAVVNTSGDVKPVSPGGLLPIGVLGIDEDVDEVADWIDSQGNSARLNEASPNNPNQGGNFPGTYSWLDARVWVNYDTRQNILVGETGYGILEINGGSALRYQHLVLGGVSDTSDNAGDLSLSTLGSNENFNFLADLSNAQLSRTGYGVLTVTGVGSVFNNDPNIIPGELQAVINFAQGNPIGTTVTDLSAVQPSSGTNPVIPVTTREDRGGADGTYDVHVGLLGSGELNVRASGRVEIQDALLVATSSSSQGTVSVDGIGSYLAAYGRSEFDGNISTSTQEFASYIGGNGRGVMSVTAGGRADFFNGLSLGAANVATRLVDAGDPDPFSSGTLVVTGAGSTLSVYPTQAQSTAGNDLGNDADFAVGELRDLTGGNGMDNLRYQLDGSLVDAPDGTTNLGEGLVRIEAGGQVNVAAAVGETGPTRGGDLGVGYAGVVEVRAGEMNVTGDIINDGRIDGHGTVRGQSLDTTVYSVILGGDPDAQPGNPTTAPLRINLAGIDDLSTPTFTNRGSVAGLVDLDATGDIDNRGTIDVGGDLSARSMTNTVNSRLSGDASFGGPLRVRLTGTDQVDDLSPAFRNQGALTGEIDLITPGGVANGDDLATLGVPSQTNGGVIDASGSIMSGTFINYGKGTITVGQGKSLAILATGTEPGLDNSLFSQITAIRVPTVLEDGINPANADGDIDATAALFYQANLGTINVDGGSIELGRLTDREPVQPQSSFHVNLFRNARFVDFPIGGGGGEETVGTINSDNGVVRFRDGVYNTGVMAFTGGNNVVGGVVLNAGSPVLFDDDSDPMTPDVVVGQGVNYDTTGTGTFIRPGIIVVSGDGTTVTFEDRVTNGGVISIGPSDNVVNFLGDFTNNGVIDVAISAATGAPESAYLTVAGNVTINGGLFALTPVGSAMSFAEGFSAEIVSAASVSAGSLFTSLDLPTLDDGLFWDIVYDEENAEVRAEVISSMAVGADFDGDQLVTQADVDIWIRNAGIESGASAIMGDVDRDGDVDLTDYDLLMVQLRQGTPFLVGPPAAGATVPEPTALVLLALAGVGALARRR